MLFEKKEAIQSLIVLINTPGWAKDLKALYQGGKFIEQLENLESPCEIEFTDIQKDILKKCLSENAEKLSPNILLTEMLEEIGFED